MQWDEVPKDKRNGEIQGYKVLCGDGGVVAMRVRDRRTDRQTDRQTDRGGVVPARVEKNGVGGGVVRISNESDRQIGKGKG